MTPAHTCRAAKPPCCTHAVHIRCDASQKVRAYTFAMGWHELCLQRLRVDSMRSCPGLRDQSFIRPPARLPPQESSEPASTAGWRRLATVADDPPPERERETQHELEIVLQVLDGLPRLSRQVFLLSRVHGLGYPEIARRCGISAKEVEELVGSVLAASLSRLEDDR